VPPELLEPVLRSLEERFTGIVTLEVFGEEDFNTSLEAVERVLGPAR
jgi:hypothetical protein